MRHNKKRFAVAPSLLLIAALTSGCGGGGSSSGSNAAPTPNITFTPGSVSISKSVNAVLNPATGRFDDVTVTVSIKNVSVAAFFPVVEFTRNTLDDVSLAGGISTSLPLTLTFKPPKSFAPGSYHDQVVVKACEDIGCSKPIAAAQGTLSITYEVTAPAAGQEPSITFSTLSFAAQSLLWDGPVDRILPFSLANFGSAPYVSASHQTSTVQVLNTNVTSITAGNLEIAPTQGFILGKGVFNDVLTVTVCLDIGCVNPVAGSPFTINYTYTVGDSISVGGPNGYVLHAINIEAEAGAWDNVSQRFYLARFLIPSFPVIALDPETGQTGAVGSLATSSVGAMTASEDGQFLYVGLSDGRIQRLKLPDLANDLTFSVGNDSFGNIRFANDIAVMPGKPKTVAVSYSNYLRSRYTNETTGAGLYDDGIVRPDAVTAVANPPSGTLVNVVSFSADGATLYGAGELFGTAPKLYVLPILASGFGLPAPSVDILGGRAHPVGNLLFMDGGTVVDTAANNATQDISPLKLTTDSLPVPDAGRIFVLGSDTFGPNMRLVALDLNNYSVIASIDLPSSVATNLIRGSLVRLRDHEIAYRSQNYVVTITGPFVKP